jgi:hypothetical protein
MVRSRTVIAAAGAVAVMACAAITPIVLPTHAAAQGNPTMTNVIPDGGSFAVQGKIQAINAGAGTVTVIPASNIPLPMTARSGVSLANLEVGDTVSTHYSRSVNFLVATPQVQVPAGTSTIGQVARTPGGIGPQAMEIVGTVTKLDSADRFDVVNSTGGGVYTIQVTDPARLALVKTLKVGDTVAISVGALTLTAIAKCGWFGC